MNGPIDIYEYQSVSQNEFHFCIFTAPKNETLFLRIMWLN